MLIKTVTSTRPIQEAKIAHVSALGSAARYRHCEDQTALVAAALVATRLSKTPPCRRPPDTGAAIPLERAWGIRRTLTRYRTELWKRLDPGSSSTWRVLRALAEGDEADLAKAGIDVRYAWLDDLVAAMVRAAPLVEVETIGPYAMNHINADVMDVRAESFPPDEQAGLLLGALIRDLTRQCENVRQVSLLDERDTGPGGRALTAEERDRFVAGIEAVFRETGLILPGDTPGRDYVLLRESEYVPDVDLLIERLERGDAGTVTRSADGDVVFHPTDRFVDKLALHSPNRKQEFRRRGITIARAGEPSCHALEAATFLRHPINHKIMHVVMLDRRFAAQQDKAYALLRALDIVRQDRHYNVFYDSAGLSPHLIAYAVCELVGGHLERFLNQPARQPETDRLYESASVDPEEYLLRRGDDAIPTGVREVVEFVTAELARCDIPVAGTGLVANVGSGPDLYPAMLLRPYVRDDGAIDLIELDAANRVYAGAALLEQADGHRPDSWRQFEDLMVAVGGDRYAGVRERTHQLVGIVAGSIFALPRNRFDIVTALSLAEVLTSFRGDLRRAVWSLASAVKPGGLLIVAHALRSAPGRAARGRLFPPYPVTLMDIEEAYRDADLSFRLSRPIGGSVGADGEGRETVVAIARRERGTGARAGT